MLIKNLYPLLRKFLKYISVGSICSACDYSVYSLFLFIGFDFKIAALFAEMIGVFYNYHSHGKLVFKTSGKSMLKKFAAVYFLSYLINISFLQILHCFKMNMYLAEALLIPLLAVINFSLNNKFVFVKKTEAITPS